jgi:lipopolysaccharide transport system permease protein
VSLFYSLISLAVLSFSLVIFNGYLNWTIVFIPIVLLPFIVLILGFSLALASIGVFLRDVSQVMTMFTTILMFLSPVFYPLSAVPTKYIPLIMANPLTFIIQQAREVLILGNLPDWYGLFIYTSFSFLVAWVGYALFQKTRKGFSDVL